MTTEQDASNAFITSVQAFYETTRQQTNDPADQIRILTSLAQNAPILPPTSMSQFDPATIDAVQGTAAAMRRAILTSLAMATASYSPTSSNDVATILSSIVPLYDADISYAGDVGDDYSFQFLRTLRSNVIMDLQARGGTLPQLITITRNVSLPACVISQQQYLDGSRADDIISRVNPINPLFMPATMTILNS